MTTADYLDLLTHSYEVEKDSDFPLNSRLDYLGQHIFDFTTYDSDMSALFARRAVDVCLAITKGTTFEYIKDAENYRWYLLMCNTPFFASKIDWGCSIRGAFWNYELTFQSCGLWSGDKQLCDEMKFTSNEWTKFIYAIAGFAACE